MASPLEKRFRKAVWLIRNGPPKDPPSSTEEKLKFYSLYKQATEGDVTAAQPWAVQLEARAKWDAWDGVKGMSKEEAMQAYVDLVAEGDARSTCLCPARLRQPANPAHAAATVWKLVCRRFQVGIPPGAIRVQRRGVVKGRFYSTKGISILLLWQLLAM
jgi:diazepam-binding inhibitor (GABA receptor modulating acyl-CoA-binding protein)